MTHPIDSAAYKGVGIPIQNSFRYKSHQNLDITAVAATSAVIDVDVFFLTLSVYAHVGLGHEATLADFVMPPGLWPMKVTPGTTISVLKAGTPDGVASLIIPQL